MAKSTLSTIWENKSNVKFTVIQESAEQSSEVDGVHILARVVGPAFFPDTTSRNRVHYSLEAWEHAINDPDFQERLANRLVFGTIGHDPEMTDNEVRDGIHTHIVTKAWIDEDTKIGMAEYLILNTDPGKVLNTLFRAKSKISVSTRAYGEVYEDRSPEGAEVVIPETFFLERIDFVLDPGYKQAKPILKEHNQKTTTEETAMADVITEHFEKQLNKLQEANAISAADVKELNKLLTEAKVNEAQFKAELTGYQALGTTAKLTESLTRLAKYESLGTEEEIQANLEEGAVTIQELTEEIERLQALKAELEAKVQESEGYADLGTPEEINQALDLAQEVKEDLDQYDEFGTAEEIRASLAEVDELKEELEQYKEFGTPEEIRSAFDSIEKFNEESEKAELEDLAEEYGADPEAIALLKSKGLTVEEIETVLDGVSTVEGSAEVDITEEDQEGQAEDENEEVFGESLSSSVLRTLSRMNRIRESKGKVGNRKMAGRKSFKESKATSANQTLLSKLIK